MVFENRAPVARLRLWPSRGHKNGEKCHRTSRWNIIVTIFNSPLGLEDGLISATAQRKEGRGGGKRVKASLQNTGGWVNMRHSSKFGGTGQKKKKAVGVFGLNRGRGVRRGKGHSLRPKKISWRRGPLKGGLKGEPGGEGGLPAT